MAYVIYPFRRVEAGGPSLGNPFDTVVEAESTD